ncbi:MAG TPA: hypothetical protein VGM18_09630 [Candidatus Sulfotelmatobacter sp.]|jgi:hypothetical protein
MKKKVLGAALLLMATVFASNAFAAVNDCSGTPTIQAIGVGSSGMYNAMSYAMVSIVSNNSFNTSSYSMISNKAGNLLLTDSRFSTSLNDTPTITVVWSNNDGSNNCNVWAYFSVDSGIGIKDYFAWKKVTVGTATFSVAAVYPAFTGTFSSANKVGGLPDNLQGLSALPTTIFNALNTPPVPSSQTDTPFLHGLAYCGYQSGGSAKAGTWCKFNFGFSDERPEDNLFMVTRALSSIPAAGGLTGLGYNNGGCLAGTDGTAAQQGCPIVDSFGGSNYFNVLTFKLSGTDPITSGTIPAYTSLRVGAVPILAFVNNGDTAALGFGGKYTDANSHSHYAFTNINKKVLSLIYDGTLHCTGDLLPGTPVANNNIYDQGWIAGPPPGAGKPIQVVQREMLSGTYTAFEYTGVRTLGGSGNPFVAKASSTAWVSDADSGQEYGNDPTTNFSSSHCGGTVALNAGLSTAPDGTVSCGDPLFIITGEAGKTCGTGLRLRTIGTGQEVPAALGQKNKGGSVVTDGIGYAFWSYGNFAPAVTSCNTALTSQTAYNASCTPTGHYLTVDSVDPLFITPGGENDAAYGGVNNPAGAFNLPQCNLTSSALPCIQLPFTHVYDGTYPLWSINTLVTFQNVGSGTGQTLFTPLSVLSLVANAQIQVASPTLNLSDFVPVYKNINTTNNPPTGDLNVGVFRSHYKETNSPNNGHAACAGVFTNVDITGSTKGSSNKCLIDAGADAGGSVLTVQSDVDFNVDFGSLFLSGAYEIYDLRQ